MELYQHQRVALSYLRTNDSFGLFMEQGTGKTLVALARVAELLRSGKAETALVVAPKSTMGAWERDVEKFDADDRARLEGALTVINYDKVWRGGDANPYDRQWDVIILDEAHCIKNRTSRRSKFLLRLSLLAKYRYVLTGTPISNGQLENVWSLMAFMFPTTVRGRVASTVLGTYAQFQDRHCILDRYHKPCSYVRVDELQDAIAEHSYRVLKADCLDLPEKLPDEVVKVDCACRRDYNRLAKESALVDYGVLAENPLARLVKLRQMCSGLLVTDDGEVEVPCGKPAMLREVVEGMPDGKPFVVFCEFRHSIRAVCDLLADMGVTHVTLDGEQSDKTIWRRFQSDGSIRAIVCQYQTASAGIDLYRADTIIYYEPTLRSNLLEQSRDRIHRTGQTSACSYVHLITRGTVEVDIYRALRGYADFSAKMFVETIRTYTRGGGRR